MIVIFDIRIGRFSVLVTHGGDRYKYCGFTQEPGEVTLDLPFASVFFTNHKKAETL